MTTPEPVAQHLLRKLRQQARVEGFKVSLASRYAELRLHRHERKLPDTATTIAFFVVLTGDAVDRVEVHIGGQPVLVHQLINGKRTWRTSTVAQAHEETDDEGNPPAASALHDRPAPQRAGATP
jgi:hypothetical protein